MNVLAFNDASVPREATAEATGVNTEQHARVGSQQKQGWRQALMHAVEL